MARLPVICQRGDLTHAELEVCTRNAGHHSEHNKHSHQREDRYSNDPCDNSGDSLGAACVAPWLGIDLVPNTPADDDTANSYQSSDDAGEPQDGAKDAEDERQCRLRMLRRRRGVVLHRAVRAHAAKGWLIRIGLIGNAAVTTRLSIAQVGAIALIWICVRRWAWGEAMCWSGVRGVGRIVVWVVWNPVWVRRRSAVGILRRIGRPVSCPRGIRPIAR